MTSTNKLIRDLTDQELRDEYKHWDDKIVNATGWGAALGAADEFRRECAAELHKRGLSDA